MLKPSRHNAMSGRRLERARIQGFMIVQMLVLVPGLVVIPLSAPAVEPSLLAFVSMYVGLLLWLVMRAAANMVALSDIELREAGLTLSILDNWTVTVPWDEVGDMDVISTLTWYRATFWPEPGFSRQFERKPVVAVSIKGLTLMHRLAGVACGLGLRPVFIITEEHEACDMLVEKMKEFAAR